MNNAVAVIKSFVNTVEGVEARVWLTDVGTYNVTLFDIDAQETVPVYHNGFKTIDSAEVFAKKIANV